MLALAAAADSLIQIIYSFFKHQFRLTFAGAASSQAVAGVAIGVSFALGRLLG